MLLTRTCDEPVRALDARAQWRERAMDLVSIVCSVAAAVDGHALSHLLVFVLWCDALHRHHCRRRRRCVLREQERLLELAHVAEQREVRKERRECVRLRGWPADDLDVHWMDDKQQRAEVAAESVLLLPMGVADTVAVVAATDGGGGVGYGC